MFKGINVVSITVPDLPAAKAFYSEILGLGAPTYDFPDAGWIEFSTGGPGGAISVVPASGPFQPANSTTVVLNVESCDRAVAALRGRGVRCDDPVGVPGMVTYANFYDPWGNRLQMCSAPPAA
ncbi:MAG TPA: VOC family protein [Devosia sp.]|nr:VOC family protein [Devosia sp.]